MQVDAGGEDTDAEEGSEEDDEDVDPWILRFEADIDTDVDESTFQGLFGGWVVVKGGVVSNNESRVQARP